MGDHFDENEKNPPGGATVAKYSKQILKLIYLHYLTAPRDARGVKRTRRTQKLQPRSVCGLIFRQN